MGGELEIESEEGKGSTFFFTLTFDKVKDAKPRDILNLHGFRVGLLGSEGRMIESIRRNLEAYVTHTGAKFELYNETEVFKAESKSLPDILFIDHMFHQRSGELDVFLDLTCKSVLMTTADKKKSIENIVDRIDRVIYKPLNLTKTMKALEAVYEEEVTTKSTKQVVEPTEGIRFDGLHILVAEDNTINQKLIKNVLNGFGVDVTLASNGQEAFDLRIHNDYDLIFMDIQMPVLGGIEATQKILAYEEKNRLRHVPIVALTANALSGDREKYMDAGMDNYLSKPIDLERLNILLQEYFPTHVRTQKRESTTEEGADNSVAQETQNPAVVQEDTSGKLEERIEVQSEATPQKREKVEPEEKREKRDILLYHSLSLVADLYERMLTNLGYSVDKVLDEQLFMDKLENPDVVYRFVIFQGKPFANVKCLISDLVQSTGAKPFVIISGTESGLDFCCSTLEEGSSVEMVKQKLMHAQ
jgi:CheY-like chemotaxis protein